MQAAAGNLDGINGFRDNLWLYGRIGGDLTDSIFIGEVWAFTVDGQMVRGITDNEGGPVHIRAGSIAPGPPGNVFAAVGNIGLVQVAGNMLGNIVAQNGSINNLDVAGDIGTVLNPAVIASDGDINVINGLNIYANIDAGTVLAPADISTLTATGIFDGTLDAATLKAGNALSIGGNFEGAITLASSRPATSEIRIGDSLASGSSINLPANGLAGQIVVNNNDAGGQWLGTVNVGATALTTAGYTEAAASLGGGSVGLAPFDLHGESSLPTDGMVVEWVPGLTATVRHYGPVTFASAPFTVSRRSFGTSDPFTDVTSDFDFAPAAGDADSVVASQSVGGAGFVSGFEYQITPTASLLSQGVVGDPAVASYTYTFSALPGCGASDLNGDGVVNGGDISFILNAWGPCPGCPEDLNGDGVVDGGDISFILNNWGPCASSSMMMVMGGPVIVEATLSPTLQQLGFTSIEEYFVWAESLTKEELHGHILDVIELLLAR